MSKRKLLQLVNEKRVSGWDDPRMPTIAGMRRRGVTPEALRDFAELIGVAKNNSVVDIGKLEFAIRGDLERALAARARGARPAPARRHRLAGGQGRGAGRPVVAGRAGPRREPRKVPFGRELLIEREDFSLDPPKDWKRLAPGREVRLAGAYVVRCNEVVRGPGGEVTELRCTHDPASLADPAASRRAQGTIHWVHAARSVAAPVRLYDRLFAVELPDAEPDFLQALNPASLVVAERRARRARARERRAREPLAVPPPGLLLRRSGRVAARRAGLQPDHHAPRHLGRPGRREARRGAAAAGEEGRRGRRPPRRGRRRAEFRAEARAADPALAARHAAYTKEHRLSADEADLLAGDPATAAYFDAAVAAGGEARGRGALAPERPRRPRGRPRARRAPPPGRRVRPVRRARRRRPAHAGGREDAARRPRRERAASPRRG